jgi:hypothetical protein
MKETRGIQKDRITETETRKKHCSLIPHLVPDEVEQAQFYCLPACIMNRSENFSIINLEIKFK